MEGGKEAYVEALKSEQVQHHIEFFRKTDDAREQGLVNHIPLTLLAAAYLGAPVADLRPFLGGKYERFLQNFGAELVPPITGDTPGETGKEKPEAVAAVLRLAKEHPGSRGMVSVAEKLEAEAREHGIQRVVNVYLRHVLLHGSTFANVFHSILLVAFPFELETMGVTQADAEELMRPLVCSGLAMTLTKATNALCFGPLVSASARAEPLTAVAMEAAMEAARADPGLTALWDDLKTAAGGKPMLLFNFTPYWSAAQTDAARRWQHVYARHLDLCGAFRTAEATQATLGVLAAVALRYYTIGQGFLAVHIVSAIRALHLLARVVADAAVYEECCRHVWRQATFLMITLELDAKRQGMGGVARARGERGESEVTPEELHPDPLPEWAALCRQATDTNASHTIKLVYAVYALARHHTAHPDAARIDRDARHSAAIAVACRIN